HPTYGLSVVGFVDDTTDSIAKSVMPQWGTLVDLDDAVRSSGADVLLVADGDFSEHRLYDTIRTPACQPCDLLVVPRLSHFHTQAGRADHIGSIPVMRIRTPSLRGPAWAVKRVFDITIAGALLLMLLPVLGVCA